MPDVTRERISDRPGFVVVMNWVWLLACASLIGMSVWSEFLPSVTVAGRLGLLIPILGGVFRGYFDGLGPILDRRKSRRVSAEAERSAVQQ
jgi:hypothetical protein